MNPLKARSLLWAAMLASAAYAHAAEEQSLDQAASDPTASLMSLQMADWHTFDYHGSDATDNIIMLRSAIPFEIGDQKHIVRVSAPIITDHPVLESGLSDMTIFDLATFDQSWGRFGAGVVALLPSGGSQRGAGQWALGPALGFVARKPGLMYGLFNQNVFTVAGDDNRTPINSSSIQVILNHGLGNGWSISASEMQAAYDWEESRWSNLPLGMGISKLQKFDGLPVQFSLQYEHNFADDEVAPADLVRFNVKLLMPAL